MNVRSSSLSIDRKPLAIAIATPEQMGTGSAFAHSTVNFIPCLRKQVIQSIALFSIALF
ncbi:MAG: hypothetical protein HC879_03225 [Leptolyngbyaceae cyanobacterium SL_5_9]|nr:hypothetical protein [Leptolyngbyaceae cyanobacterium SL_5_9]